jgi:hypothetical protein
MGRWLTWVSDQRLQGWACSQCDWTFPVPPLLTDPEAKSAYDRLASVKFREHDCAKHGQRGTAPAHEGFAERARQLVIRGFKPKDAAEITIQEILLEHRHEPGATERAHADAADFLRRVKDGLI